MKKLQFKLLTAWSLMITSYSFAQVSQRSIVEHFTNTSCSICAANNNAIHTSIKSQPNVVHISFHPSSPYSNDFFNTQNKSENDGRTNFYGIYGSTPRVVLNGNPIPYSTLTTALGNSSSNTTNFSLKISQLNRLSDSISVRLVIKKEGPDTLTKAALFVGVIEDTINQLTNNGEKVHLNVFRKALTANAGNNLDLPLKVGDSLVITLNFKAHSSWDLKRLEAIGILQRKSRVVINSAISLNSSTPTADIKRTPLNLTKNVLFPNPVIHNEVFSMVDIDKLQIFNSNGQLIHQSESVKQTESYPLKDLKPGIYIAKCKIADRFFVQKLIIQ